jgi:deoxycytidine triphosphate deaminase
LNYTRAVDCSHMLPEARPVWPNQGIGACSFLDVLLSDRDLRAEVESGRVKIDPYDPGMVQPSSVDVRLDRYFRVFENHRYPHIDPAQEQPDLTRLVEVEPDQAFILHPGEFVLASTYEMFGLPADLAARLEGKALAVHTPVPTPAGWRTMGELRVGDLVFDEHGDPTPIVAATEIMYGRECREVVFSDGQSMVADLNHRWLTRTKHSRRIRTTREIERTLGDEHRVPLAGPARYPRQDLPIDPYTLGSRVPENIPEIYLRSSPRQRLALLQGLMDSGGSIDEHGWCEFPTTREHLADALVDLAAGLGLCPTKRKQPAPYDEGVAYRVEFTPNIPVFRLQRKLDLMKPGRSDRTIVDMIPVHHQAVRCIQVAAPSGLFLAGPTYIPTHNSSLGRLGLLTHSTAGWIDPGFCGHVTLELSNVATLPIKLWPGMKIGQMCLFRTSSPVEHPYGSDRHGSRYQDQRGPTPSRSYLNFHRTRV